MIEALRITKRYGPTLALDGVDLTVHSGQTHALVGRNGAGKSTLVSILTGLTKPDAGLLTITEKVACVYQRSMIVPALSVAENLFLHQSPRLQHTATSVLSEYGLDIDVRRPAGELNVEQRQLVEIARALSSGARFIILDEPTAQLDTAGIGRLFNRMRSLQRNGVTFLFISHHLHEVYDVCQTVTVLRDGRHVITSQVTDLPREALIEAMTGAPPMRRKAVRPRTLGAPALETSICRVLGGELVGLAGSGSSGKAEFAESLAGLHPPWAPPRASALAAGASARVTASPGVTEPEDQGDAAGRPVRSHGPEAGWVAGDIVPPDPPAAGQAAREVLRPSDATAAVRVAGKAVAPGDPAAAWAAGLGLVPRDRHRQGLVPQLSVAENLTLPVPESPRRRKPLARRLIEQLGIVTAGPDQPVSGLSGGNAQKTVLGRALSRQPKLLVLINPTAGVDVRSRESLMDSVEAAAAAGAGVLIVSDELDDLHACDRVLVMYHGAVVAEFARGWAEADLVSAIEGVTAVTP